MKRMVLACSALFLLPVVSGCCSCGCAGSVDPCGGYAGGSYSSGNYSECLPAYGGTRTIPNQAMCNNCQSDGGFALPPATSSGAPLAAVPGYGYQHQPGDQYPNGAFPVGPETIGPEVVVGPAYGPGDSGWTYQTAPPVPGTANTVTPANPNSYSQGGTNALLPPAPLPTIPANSVVIPAPIPAEASTGPMMPPVPPPPSEPVSQMRYRRSR